MSETNTDDSLGKVIDAVIMLRDMKEEIVRRHKAELEAVTTKIGRLENHLAAAMQARGLTALKGPGGTAFLKFVDTATVADFAAVLEHVRTEDAWELLKGAVSKEAVKEYIKLHGTPPPGVNYTQAQVCQVRRS